MLDIHNLERRWLRYKIKSYLPYAAGAVLILFLILIGSIRMQPNTASLLGSSDPISQKQIQIPAKSAQKSVTVSHESTMILEPSMDFVQTLRETSQPEESLPIANNAPSARPIKQVSTPLPPPPETKMLLVPDPPSATPKTQPVQSSQTIVSVNRSESSFDISELERRFKESSNPNLGLFIARYYYDRGDYSQAYNYALKTNAINSRIDESWIIFSKSLVKLGKTDQAKKTLQLYSSQSGSDAARGLLDAIEKGNFK